MIHSEPFGPTILSGEDAEAFLRQLDDVVDMQEKMLASLERGREILRQWEDSLPSRKL